MNSRRFITITDERDPRLADYRITRDDGELRRQKIFVVEGKVVLRVMTSASRFPLRSVFVAQNKLGGVVEELDRVPESIPIYAAPHELLNRVAHYPVHRGILCAGGREPQQSVAELIDGLGPGQRLVLLLHGLTENESVGAVFRNAAAFGADGILLGPQCADPLHRKSLRVSSGGSLIVPFAPWQATERQRAILTGAGFRTVELTCQAAAPSLHDLIRLPSKPARLALIVAPHEGAGPQLEAALRARLELAGPVNGLVGDLSVATASGIALYSLCQSSTR